MKNLARKHNSYVEVRLRMGRYIYVWALSGQHCCKLQITASGAHLDFVAGVVQGEGGLVDIQSIPIIFRLR